MRRRRTWNKREPLELEWIHLFASQEASFITIQEESLAPRKGTHPAGPLWQRLRECKSLKVPAPGKSFMPLSVEVRVSLLSLEAHSPFTTMGLRIIRIHFCLCQSPQEPHESLVILHLLGSSPQIQFYMLSFLLPSNPLHFLKLTVPSDISDKSKVKSIAENSIFYSKKKKIIFVWESSLHFLIQKKIQISSNYMLPLQFS